MRLTDLEEPNLCSLSFVVRRRAYSFEETRDRHFTGFDEFNYFASTNPQPSIGLEQTGGEENDGEQEVIPGPVCISFSLYFAAN